MEALDSEPAAALEAAVRLNDAARVRDVLARFPALARRLDEPMPNGDFGATPLIAAAHLCNLEMMDALLDAGANPDARSEWWAGGFSAFGDNAVVNAHLIARGATVDAHDAAKLGMFDRLRDLVEADPAIVHARFGDGQTPLHVASTVEIAEYLLDRGANVDAQDVDHESTPAQYLIGEHPDVARLLVARGCRTDILLACALGDIALARQHLDADPDAVRTTVSADWFPMRDARAGGTIYIWTLGNELTAHDVARKFGHPAVVRLLDERSPADLRLAVACEAGDAASAARLAAELDSSGSVRPPLPGGRLIAVVSQDKTVAARLMLAHGWSAHARDAKGVTPLHWAAWHGNLDLVRELLGAGADVQATESGFGGTPLVWAEHGADHSWRRAVGDHVAVIALLRQQRGAIS